MSTAGRTPSADVLRAFGARGDLVNLNGGRGQTWATPDMVIKPADDSSSPAEWIAELALRVPQERFRLARPIRASNGAWVVSGWCAWTRLVGEHRTDRWGELIAAADAFHHAVRLEDKPTFLAERTDRWSVADRLAWGEIAPEEFGEITHIRELIGARRSLDLRPQLIHGDLAGNVLFADGLAPAIIDLSLYWRPAAYAAALVVVDAIAWEGAPLSTTGLLVTYRKWRQLFLRAVIFRVAVSELARRAIPEREDASEHYHALVQLALKVAADPFEPNDLYW